MNVLSFFHCIVTHWDICRDKRGVLFVSTRINVKSFISGCIPL